MVLIMELICSLLLLDSSISEKIGIQRGFLNIRSLVYDRSQEAIDDTAIHIGDSVARQLFPPFRKDANLTSVANVLASGNYIAIKNALENNPEITTVYYGAIPTSLSLDFYEKKTSLNFIKPFLSIYRPGFLDGTILKAMMTQPKSLLYLTSFGKFIPMDDINFGKETIKGRKISRFSLRYILKMKELCDEHNVKFIMYCPPLSSERKGATNDFSTLRTQKYPAGLKKLLRNYMNTIKYRDAKDYKDGTHLKRDYLKEARKQYSGIVQRMNNTY